MKPILFLTLVAFGISVPQARIKLEVGAKLDRKYIPKKLKNLLMTHPGQLRPFIKRTIGGVRYDIAFDKHTRQIKYIYTNDPNFRTTDGLHVSSKIPLRREQLQVYPGWEIRGPARGDGWFPVVGFDSIQSMDTARDYNDELETRLLAIIGFSKGGN